MTKIETPNTPSMIRFSSKKANKKCLQYYKNEKSWAKSQKTWFFLKNSKIFKFSKTLEKHKNTPKMHFMRFLTIISDFELKKFFFDFLGPMTRFHQKCLSQDIVQARPLILFLVYFYDSYLQHIKSCQGKVDFEMNLRISLSQNGS